jgi:metal-dependent amidase/aminoacylase/carboxypeptidase family protein
MTADARVITHALRGPSDDLLAKVEGNDVTQGVGGTGVVGMLRNGEGPTVLLRADMDALPIKESTGLSYASNQTGTDRFGQATSIAHSRGHDLHVTWLMGVTLFRTGAAAREHDQSTQSAGGTYEASARQFRRGDL